eukprot:CAMPEP_0182608718 /NCGR_PEP_ID=MMETSP1330-20130603/3051_1 /TAXON_ID=464278 /ORGANISM="Picochlorum sp., Strain RCC944" /LENGTH=129 /DNA_ID=CAMNT_0024827501 /DNA_START=27 /DNA_END=416 /DNA_ORIENTATION=-
MACIQGPMAFIGSETKGLSPKRTGRAQVVVLAKAKARQRKGGLGFVEEDNSGKANIFAVEPRTLYTSSPRADREARKGLGGAQGLGIAVGLIGVVAAATIGVGFLQGEDGVETLGYEGGETLQDIAARM